MTTNRHRIIEYLQGMRKGKAANRIEREAQQDPFWAEAFSGYDRHNDDHAAAILLLEQRLKAQAAKRKRPAWPWAVAACIAVLVGAGFLLFLWQAPVADTLPVVKLSTTDTLPVAELPDRHEPTAVQSPLSLERKSTIVQKEPDVHLKPPPPNPPEKDMSFDSLGKEDTKSIATIIPEKDMSSDSPVAIMEVAENTVPAISVDESMKVASGIVSEEGIPLEGASVSIKGAPTAVLTDMGGRYAIPVQDSNTLVFSFIGMNTEEIPVAGKTTIDVNLVADAIALEEVVVVGYGVMKRTSIPDIADETAIPLIGKKAYRDYLKQTLRQPSDSLCAKAKGKVELLFYIDEQGNPFDIEITTGLCPSCDEEAIRLIKEGGQWTLSKRPVRQTIRFRGK
ncbi:MAG: carboxypeptidase-like regulatory domain-containing protein [Prevotellaceae bacterium]|jgi:outer membrane biosynthesis protein TonB|nr:carboxypeptidase-like regulatory domain-containing protein [Prevotellaceae bacterium]